MEQQKSRYDPLQGTLKKDTDERKQMLDIPKKSTVQKKMNKEVAAKPSHSVKPAETITSPITVHNTTSQSSSKFEAVKKSVRPLLKPKALDTRKIHKNDETQSARTPQTHEITAKHIKSRPTNKILTKPMDSRSSTKTVTESLKDINSYSKISAADNPKARDAEGLSKDTTTFQSYLHNDNSRSALSQEDAKSCESPKSLYKVRSISVPAIFPPFDKVTTPPLSISKGSHLSYSGLFRLSSNSLASVPESTTEDCDESTTKPERLSVSTQDISQYDSGMGSTSHNAGSPKSAPLGMSKGLLHKHGLNYQGLSDSGHSGSLSPPDISASGGDLHSGSDANWQSPSRYSNVLAIPEGEHYCLDWQAGTDESWKRSRREENNRKVGTVVHCSESNEMAGQVADDEPETLEAQKYISASCPSLNMLPLDNVEQQLSVTDTNSITKRYRLSVQDSCRAGSNKDTDETPWGTASQAKQSLLKDSEMSWNRMKSGSESTLCQDQQFSNENILQRNLTASSRSPSMIRMLQRGASLSMSKLHLQNSHESGLDKLHHDVSRKHHVSVDDVLFDQGHFRVVHFKAPESNSRIRQWPTNLTTKEQKQEKKHSLVQSDEQGFRMTGIQFSEENPITAKNDHTIQQLESDQTQDDNRNASADPTTPADDWSRKCQDESTNEFIGECKLHKDETVNEATENAGGIPNLRAEKNSKDTTDFGESDLQSGLDQLEINKTDNLDRNVDFNRAEYKKDINGDKHRQTEASSQNVLESEHNEPHRPGEENNDLSERNKLQNTEEMVFNEEHKSNIMNDDKNPLVQMKNEETEGRTKDEINKDTMTADNCETDDDQQDEVDMGNDGQKSKTKEYLMDATRRDNISSEEQEIKNEVLRTEEDKLMQENENTASRNWEKEIKDDNQSRDAENGIISLQKGDLKDSVQDEMEINSISAANREETEENSHHQHGEDHSKETTREKSRQHSGDFPYTTDIKNQDRESHGSSVHNKEIRDQLIPCKDDKGERGDKASQKEDIKESADIGGADQSNSRSKQEEIKNQLLTGYTPDIKSKLFPSEDDKGKRNHEALQKENIIAGKDGAGSDIDETASEEKHFVTGCSPEINIGATCTEEIRDDLTEQLERKEDNKIHPKEQTKPYLSCGCDAEDNGTRAQSEGIDNDPQSIEDNANSDAFRFSKEILERIPNADTTERKVMEEESKVGKLTKGGKEGADPGRDCITPKEVSEWPATGANINKDIRYSEEKEITDHLPAKPANDASNTTNKNESIFNFSPTDIMHRDTIIPEHTVNKGENDDDALLIKGHLPTESDSITQLEVHSSGSEANNSNETLPITTECDKGGREELKVDFSGTSDLEKVGAKEESKAFTPSAKKLELIDKWPNQDEANTNFQSKQEEKKLAENIGLKDSKVDLQVPLELQKEDQKIANKSEKQTEYYKKGMQNESRKEPAKSVSRMETEGDAADQFGDKCDLKSEEKPPKYESIDSKDDNGLLTDSDLDKIEKKPNAGTVKGKLKLSMDPEREEVKNDQEESICLLQGRKEHTKREITDDHTLLETEMGKDDKSSKTEQNTSHPLHREGERQDKDKAVQLEESRYSLEDTTERKTNLQYRTQNEEMKIQRSADISQSQSRKNTETTTKIPKQDVSIDCRDTAEVDDLERDVSKHEPIDGTESAVHGFNSSETTEIERSKSKTKTDEASSLESYEGDIKLQKKVEQDDIQLATKGNDLKLTKSMNENDLQPEERLAEDEFKCEIQVNEDSLQLGKNINETNLQTVKQFIDDLQHQKKGHEDKFQIGKKINENYPESKKQLNENDAQHEKKGNAGDLQTGKKISEHDLESEKHLKDNDHQHHKQGNDAKLVEEVYEDSNSIKMLANASQLTEGSENAKPEEGTLNELRGKLELVNCEENEDTSHDETVRDKQWKQTPLAEDCLMRYEEHQAGADVNQGDEDITLKREIQKDEKIKQSKYEDSAAVVTTIIDASINNNETENEISERQISDKNKNWTQVPLDECKQDDCLPVGAFQSGEKLQRDDKIIKQHKRKMEQETEVRKIPKKQERDYQSNVDCEGGHGVTDLIVGHTEEKSDDKDHYQVEIDEKDCGIGNHGEGRRDNTRNAVLAFVQEVKKKEGKCDYLSDDGTEDNQYENASRYRTGDCQGKVSQHVGHEVEANEEKYGESNYQTKVDTDGDGLIAENNEVKSYNPSDVNSEISQKANDQNTDQKVKSDHPKDAEVSQRVKDEKVKKDYYAGEYVIGNDNRATNRSEFGQLQNEAFLEADEGIQDIEKTNDDHLREAELNVSRIDEDGNGSRNHETEAEQEISQGHNNKDNEDDDQWTENIYKTEDKVYHQNEAEQRDEEIIPDGNYPCEAASKVGQRITEREGKDQSLSESQLEIREALKQGADNHLDQSEVGQTVEYESDKDLYSVGIDPEVGQREGEIINAQEGVLKVSRITKGEQKEELSSEPKLEAIDEVDDDEGRAEMRNINTILRVDDKDGTVLQSGGHIAEEMEGQTDNLFEPVFTTDQSSVEIVGKDDYPCVAGHNVDHQIKDREGKGHSSTETDLPTYHNDKHRSGIYPSRVVQEAESKSDYSSGTDLDDGQRRQERDSKGLCLTEANHKLDEKIRERKVENDDDPSVDQNIESRLETHDIADNAGLDVEDKEEASDNCLNKADLEVGHGDRYGVRDYSCFTDQETEQLIEDRDDSSNKPELAGSQHAGDKSVKSVYAKDRTMHIDQTVDDKVETNHWQSHRVEDSVEKGYYYPRKTESIIGQTMEGGQAQANCANEVDLKVSTNDKERCSRAGFLIGQKENLGSATSDSEDGNDDCSKKRKDSKYSEQQQMSLHECLIDTTQQKDSMKVETREHEEDVQMITDQSEGDLNIDQYGIQYSGQQDEINSYTDRDWAETRHLQEVTNSSADDVEDDEIYRLRNSIPVIYEEDENRGSQEFYEEKEEYSQESYEESYEDSLDELQQESPGSTERFEENEDMILRDEDDLYSDEDELDVTNLNHEQQHSGTCTTVSCIYFKELGMFNPTYFAEGAHERNTNHWDFSGAESNLRRRMSLGLRFTTAEDLSACDVSDDNEVNFSATESVQSDNDEFSTSRDNWLWRRLDWQKWLSASELEYTDPQDWYDGRSLSSDCILVPNRYATKVNSVESLTCTIVGADIVWPMRRHHSVPATVLVAQKSRQYAGHSQSNSQTLLNQTERRKSLPSYRSAQSNFKKSSSLKAMPQIGACEAEQKTTDESSNVSANDLNTTTPEQADSCDSAQQVSENQNQETMAEAIDFNPPIGVKAPQDSDETLDKGKAAYKDSVKQVSTSLTVSDVDAFTDKQQHQLNDLINDIPNFDRQIGLKTCSIQDDRETREIGAGDALQKTTDKTSNVSANDMNTSMPEQSVSCDFAQQVAENQNQETIAEGMDFINPQIGVKKPQDNDETLDKEKAAYKDSVKQVSKSLTVSDVDAFIDKQQHQYNDLINDIPNFDRQIGLKTGSIQDDHETRENSKLIQDAELYQDTPAGNLLNGNPPKTHSKISTERHSQFTQATNTSQGFNWTPFSELGENTSSRWRNRASFRTAFSQTDIAAASRNLPPYLSHPSLYGFPSSRTIETQTDLNLQDIETQTSPTFRNSKTQFNWSSSASKRSDPHPTEGQKSTANSAPSPIGIKESVRINTELPNNYQVDNDISDDKKHLDKTPSVLSSQSEQERNQAEPIQMASDDNVDAETRPNSTMHRPFCQSSFEDTEVNDYTRKSESANVTNVPSHIGVEHIDNKKDLSEEEIHHSIGSRDSYLDIRLKNVDILVPGVGRSPDNADKQHTKFTHKKVDFSQPPQEDAFSNKNFNHGFCETPPLSNEGGSGRKKTDSKPSSLSSVRNYNSACEADRLSTMLSETVRILQRPDSKEPSQFQHDGSKQLSTSWKAASRYNSVPSSIANSEQSKRYYSDEARSERNAEYKTDFENAPTSVKSTRLYEEKEARDMMTHQRTSKAEADKLQESYNYNFPTTSLDSKVNFRDVMSTATTRGYYPLHSYNKWEKTCSSSQQGSITVNPEHSKYFSDSQKERLLTDNFGSDSGRQKGSHLTWAESSYLDSTKGSYQAQKDNHNLTEMSENHSSFLKRNYESESHVKCSNRLKGYQSTLEDTFGMSSVIPVRNKYTSTECSGSSSDRLQASSLASTKPYGSYTGSYKGNHDHIHAESSRPKYECTFNHHEKSKSSMVSTAVQAYDSDEIERLRRERRRLLGLLVKDFTASKIRVEYAESQLNYQMDWTEQLLQEMNEDDEADFLLHIG